MTYRPNNRSDKRTRFFSAGILTIALLCTAAAVCGTASATDIYIGPGEDETTIQGAVNNATAGDTIIVRDNTYNENVDVNKSLMIRSENGSANCFVNASDPNDHVFNVSVDYVNISGFTVRNATGCGAAGIYLGSGADHCNISGNTISDNDCGIYLDSSNVNSISNNICKNNGLSEEEGGGEEGETAIHLNDSDNNLISNNNCSENDDGIALVNSDNNTVINNTANSNEYAGIHLESSTDNRILDNTCKNNGVEVSGGWTGIHLEDSDNNLISNNNCSENDHGICLDGSHNNTLTNNTASYNTLGYDPRVGIYLTDSNNNTLTNNTASHNGDEIMEGYGIQLYYSSNNTLTNNTANSNNDYGIYLWYSNNDNTLTKNTANSNGYEGFYIASSSNNTLTENTASGNYNGISIDCITDSTLTKNIVNYNNYCGINVYRSDGINITGNTVNSNNETGIRLYASSNNNVTCNWVAYNGENGFYLGGSTPCGYSVGNNISRNNIIANGVQQGDGSYQWQFNNTQNNSVVAENNYWGTDNGSIIAASINENAGSVGYVPFKTAACQCAPVPELATIALIAVGLLALVGCARIGRKE